MNLPTYRLPDLRSKLAALDDASANLAPFAERISTANTAADRIATQLAELDAQAEETTRQQFAVNDDRMAQLLSAEPVPLPTKREIEAREAQLRVIDGQRTQLRYDLDAMQQHLAELKHAEAAWQTNVAAAEANFLAALLEAVREAFQIAAGAFVPDNMRPVVTAANALWSKTGALPEWVREITMTTRVQWQESAPEGNCLVVAWPLFNNDPMLDGYPASSPDLIDRLMEAIRDSEPLGAVKPQAA